MRLRVPILARDAHNFGKLGSASASRAEFIENVAHSPTEHALNLVDAVARSYEVLERAYDRQTRTDCAFLVHEGACVILLRLFHRREQVNGAGKGLLVRRHHTEAGTEERGVEASHRVVRRVVYDGNVTTILCLNRLELRYQLLERKSGRAARLELRLPVVQRQVLTWRGEERLAAVLQRHNLERRERRHRCELLKHS